MKDERTDLRRRHGLNGSQFSALQVQRHAGCVLPTKWKWVVLQHHAVRARPATPTTGGMSVLADTERVKELARLAAEADAEAAADGQLMETQAHVCHILP